MVSMLLAMTIALVLNDPRTATAEEAVEPAPVECFVQKNPPAIVCIQDGIPILTSLLAIPTQTVTIQILPTNLPDLPIVTRFVTIKKTVTKPPVIKVVPGPTKTVRGPTRTVTASPRPTVTVTRQADPDDGTVEPDGPLNPGDGVLTTTEKILSVTGIVIAAVAAGMLMLWLGFILGYRSCDRDNRRFWSSLREQLFGNK